MLPIILKIEGVDFKRYRFLKGYLTQEEALK